jgi:hypothetical protein
MPAIIVKFLAPTTYRGARVKLSTARGHGAQTLPRCYENSMGYHPADIRKYARECWPHADLETLTGPHCIDDERDVWTFTAA